MSNALAIAAVTASIRSLIEQSFTAGPPDDDELHGYSHSESLVTALPLHKARGDRLDAQVNVFLYHVGPDAAWRNTDLPSRGRPGEVTPPTLALDLHYIITAYGAGDDEVRSHQVLGRVMRALHDHPVLTRDDVPSAYGTPATNLRRSRLAEQVERVRITPHGIPMEEFSRLWQTFQTQYRTSAAYRVSAVLIESRRPARARLPVLRRGGDDRGVAVAASPSAPEVPTLLEVSAPGGNPGVRPADVLSFHVVGAEGAAVTATLRHTLLGLEHAAALTPGTTPTLFTLALPSASTVAAGPCTVTLTVSRPGRSPVTTNALPLFVLPKIDDGSPSAAGTGAGRTVSLAFTPAAPPRQRVSLLLGDREIFAPTPTGEAARTSVTFAVPLDLPAGGYRARLRIDGADSVHVDRTTAPPTFNAPVVTLPA